MCSFYIEKETIEDAKFIDTLHSELFGPARFTRAAHLIREKLHQNLNFSFTIQRDSQLIGSIRITNIYIGELPAFLLGPLAIDSNHQKLGLGSKLIKHCLSQILEHENEAKLILLIGDYEYYNRFGFIKLKSQNIILPAPTNKQRILGLELAPLAAENLIGNVKAWK